MLTTILSFFHLLCLTCAQWPKGAQAEASSTHPPSRDGNVSFNAGLAIDGDLNSFWCDATNKVFPDTLTLIFPSAINLKGITVLSSNYGYIVAYHVSCLPANSSLSISTDASNLTTLTSTAHFSSPVQCKEVAIIVRSATGAWDTQGDWYSRIIEVTPIYADGAGALNVSTKTSGPSSALTSHPQQSQQVSQSPNQLPSQESDKSPPKPDYTGVAIGTAGGGIMAIITTALAVHRIRRRSKRGQSQIWERKNERRPVISAPHIWEAPTESQRNELGLPAPRFEIGGTQPIVPELATKTPRLELPCSSFI